MSDIDEKTKGYVYILEVKDIDLPVSKIGMTTRSPYERCTEINNSSTGDFIWAVAYYVAVDNCRKLESLVHSKLAPLRQKGREFFNINVENANKAMVSIFNGQSEIKKIEAEEIAVTVEKGSSKKKKKTKHQQNYRPIDSEYSELLQSFSSLINVKGRPFGQLNQPVFGMSDGNKGVQWNIAIWPDTGDIKLGVNLEGSEKTGKWLIAPFILSEPNIEKVKTSIQNPESVFISFTRDAWQGAARLNIIEKYLGGREFSLSEMEPGLWTSILKEALTCLDEGRGYRKRKKQQIVTLESDGREVEKDISPHLTIWSPIRLDGDITENINNKIVELQPVYDWVVMSTQS
jgi:hypothetical protein